MSVFVEENEILEALRNAEAELEGLGTDDSDRMQQILDDMQNLQNKAEKRVSMPWRLKQKNHGFNGFHGR
jgi:molecular chaperone GrpE (heat shock protein)